MKRLFNKEFLIFLLSFIALFSLAFYTHIYTKGIFDYKAFGLNNFRCNTIWIGFTISWILFILLCVYVFVHKKRLKVLSIIIVLLNILFFAQICHVQQMGKFLIVSDLFLAGEGFQYISSIFIHLNIGMVFTNIFNIIIIILMHVAYKRYDDSYLKPIKNKRYIIIAMIALIITCRTFSLIYLGHTQKEEWMENYNTKSIYNNFTNPNTSMYISGFYEYHVRAIYKYFYNLIVFDKNILKDDIDKYNSIYGITTSENDYTGIFKDKNVIFIMMESIDSWIVDENTMPTLKNLMDTGINFTNRYSPFFNGGQTINTEFALNTGLYAISTKKTIYDIDYLDYKYSLANMLKKNGYKVNSFHANTGDFYNRKNFHKYLGYENHYAITDMVKEGKLDENKDYFIDSTFMADEDILKLLVPEEKFLSFFTTYSAHLNYVEDNKIYKSIEKIENIGYDDEELIYRSLAHDTDMSIKELIDYLDKTQKLDDTVLVLATDHYVYGYSDSDFIAAKKGVKNDRELLQNTPLVIWSKDIKHENVETIMDTADILPTLLNMLGVKYNPNKYMGTDVFSEHHDDFVWFSDGNYIKGDGCTLSNEAILTKTNYNINKNRNIILTNYYGK